MDIITLQSTFLLYSVLTIASQLSTYKKKNQNRIRVMKYGGNCGYFLDKNHNFY